MGATAYWKPGTNIIEKVAEKETKNLWKRELAPTVELIIFSKKQNIFRRSGGYNFQNRLTGEEEKRILCGSHLPAFD